MAKGDHVALLNQQDCKAFEGKGQGQCDHPGDIVNS